MKKILRVYISEHWPSPPIAQWSLISTNGDLLQDGTSDPIHWPTADRYEAVLGALQTSWHLVELPKIVARRDQNRLLAYALENQLLRDPDSQHFVITHQNEGLAGVMVVSRDRLRHIVAAFTALHRPLSLLVSELESAFYSESNLQIALTKDVTLFHLGLHRTIGIDNVEPDEFLPLLISALENEESLSDKKIELHLAPDLPAPDTESWSSRLGRSVQLGTPYIWERNINLASNLLTGEFAAKHVQESWKARLKPLLWVAGTVLIIDLLLGIGSIAWQHHLLAKLEQSNMQYFLRVFPKSPAIAMNRQITQNLDQQRSMQGMLTSNDALTMLVILADALGADSRNSLHSVRYENGTLEIEFQPKFSEGSTAIIESLKRRGLLVTIRKGSANKEIYVIKPTVPT